MTVFEWLQAQTDYSFKDETFQAIAFDRGCDPDADAYGENMTQRLRDLLKADIIFHAILLRPSNTASLSQSHNGYQKTVGQEQDFYQDQKIKYAISIYKEYGDIRGDQLEQATNKKITQIPIVDVMSL